MVRVSVRPASCQSACRGRPRTTNFKFQSSKIRNSIFEIPTPSPASAQIQTQARHRDPTRRRSLRAFWRSSRPRAPQANKKYTRGRPCRTNPGGRATFPPCRRLSCCSTRGRRTRVTLRHEPLHSTRSSKQPLRRTHSSTRRAPWEPSSALSPRGKTRFVFWCAFAPRSQPNPQQNIQYVHGTTETACA